jgi:uncharacterized membrane protein
MHAPGIAHVIFGFTSLVLGVGIFSLTKGTALHRAVGALYVLSMFGLNVTALTIYRVFGGFGVFHIFSLINIVLLLAGFSAVLLQRPRKKWLRYHYYFIGWSYVGLWAATVSEVITRVPGWLFAVAVAVPTIAVTLLGGAWVQLWQHRTLARFTGG